MTAEEQISAAMKQHDKNVASVFQQVAKDPSIIPHVGKPGSESQKAFTEMCAALKNEGSFTVKVKRFLGL